MRTLLFEGVITALSSITHNGGERNGTVTQLRREKFISPTGEVHEVPIISGNAIRGILRDKGMFDLCMKLGYGVNEETGEIKGLPKQAFYFLFSGGALVSNGASALDVGYFRELKKLIPLVSIFGGAMGNSIMPGKLKIGKMIPICEETKHLIPNRFVEGKSFSTIWDYCQVEMFTRRDDAKNDKYLPLIKGKTQLTQGGLIGDTAPAVAKEEKKEVPQQMMYNVETLAAGTQFFLDITLEDVDDIEFESFLNALLVFSRTPYLGGKSATGHGKIQMKFNDWIEIDSRVKPEGNAVDVKLGEKYRKHVEDNAKEIRKLLEQIG